MAIFGDTKKKTKAKKAENAAPAAAAGAAPSTVSSSAKHAGIVLVSPRITEKGTLLAEHGAYVFNVSRSCNKHEIAAAVRAVYKVNPVSVRVLTMRGKKTRNRSTGIVGKTAGGRKAYVYLKKGETIDFA